MRLPGAQPAADLGRRHVRRRRVDQENRGTAAVPVRVRRAADTIRAASAGSRSLQALDREPRARDDDEVRQVEDVRIAVPGFNFCKRIGAGDEENLRRRQPGALAKARRACRPCTTAPARGASTSLARQAVDAVDGQGRHGEPVERRRDRLLLAVRRDARRQHEDRDRARARAARPAPCRRARGGSDRACRRECPMRRRRRSFGHDVASTALAAATLARRRRPPATPLRAARRCLRRSPPRQRRAERPRAANAPAAAPAAPDRRARRSCWPRPASACPRAARRRRRVPGTARARA